MRKNELVYMTKDALENYGKEYAGIPFVITHKATKYMSSTEFYKAGMPDGHHPGYDEGCGSTLYDLKYKETGEELTFSLYGWELTKHSPKNAN